MNRPLLVLSVVAVSLMAVTAFPEGGIAALVIVTLSALSITICRSHFARYFLTNVFLLGLIARIVFGFVVYSFNLIEFFGGDQNTYDYLGNLWADIQLGRAQAADSHFGQRAISTSGPGWGMYYFVGSIYLVFGQNMLIAQSFCMVVGAATAPMIYLCAEKTFKNNRVSKLSAIAVALFPSFIIWSSQLMKDGLIIFLLVFTMTAVLMLQEKFSPLIVALLVLALFGIMSLRFYIFYMVAVSVVGSFIIGSRGSNQSIIKRIIILIIIGFSLTYFGVVKTANTDLDAYGSLEAVQRSRSDSASFTSGYAADADVSTTAGAFAFLPVGFVYLMLAPFPWEISNFRQLITLPEGVVWWSLIPFLISGLIYTVKNRLREALPILVFALMLTLAYSISQGNVGNAYRQRTQIQVFLFIFIAVGWSLRVERKENRRLLILATREPHSTA